MDLFSCHVNVIWFLFFVSRIFKFFIKWDFNYLKNLCEKKFDKHIVVFICLLFFELQNLQIFRSQLCYNWLYKNISCCRFQWIIVFFRIFISIIILLLEFPISFHLKSRNNRLFEILKVSIIINYDTREIFIDAKIRHHLKKLDIHCEDRVFDLVRALFWFYQLDNFNFFAFTQLPSIFLLQSFLKCVKIAILSLYMRYSVENILACLHYHLLYFNLQLFHLD